MLVLPRTIFCLPFYFQAAAHCAAKLYLKTSLYVPGGGHCFPGAAAVLTRSGPKPLAEIQLGEDVQTIQGSNLGFSPILLFADRAITGQYEYHDIFVSSGQHSKASGSHFLLVGGHTFDSARMVLAADVAVGNRLWVVSSGRVEAAVAVSTELVNKTGAVNVHTGSNAL